MRTHWIVCWLAALPFMAGCATGLRTDPPRDRATLDARLAELRAHYRPFLRSRPAPLPKPQRQLLDGADWLCKYELAAQVSSPGKDEPRFVERPPAPAYFTPGLNERDWQSTSVPEWQYGMHGRKNGYGAILWYRKHFPAAKPEAGRRAWLVFEGADWFAEVWLNGRKLGEHSVYHEPFRFDVTEVLAEQNELAVRITSGRRFGEPAAYWTVFPVPNPPGKDPLRYVPDRSKSLLGVRSDDTHVGDGYGIHRSVYLETTGSTRLDQVFVRCNPDDDSVKIAIEVDAAAPANAAIQVELMPENFDGPAVQIVQEVPLTAGANTLRLSGALPDVRRWSPETPYLYRARACVTTDGRTEVRDAVFGARTFAMVTAQAATPDRPEGLFLLNGEPMYLRGANIQGLNALYYWGQPERIVDALLMLKAGGFNSVRACQHVCFPEVLELLDRMGVVSEQDQGTRAIETPATMTQLELAARALARETYNHPGVVFISFANECSFDPTSCIQAALAADPDRLIAPISGQMDKGGNMWIKNRENYPQLPADLWANVINDVHNYMGWYGGMAGMLWKMPASYPADQRMQVIGEYGSEALDAYATMRDHYMPYWKPTPLPGEDRLWGAVQIEKADRRQIFGFRGRIPKTLSEYIIASQTYQADQLTVLTRAWRLSPHKVSGYFQFHFYDVLPANWPKCIVSHDFEPKRGFYAMAQLNQPIVPLPVLSADGQQLSLWTANDTVLSDAAASIVYVVRTGRSVWAQGTVTANVKAYDALEAGTVSLETVPADTDTVSIDLELRDADGRRISAYSGEFFIRAWRVKEAILPSKPSTAS